MYFLKYTALLLCIFPWVSSSPVKEEADAKVPELISGGGTKVLDHTVVDYLTLVLENIREKMISGIPGVPVLDPLSLGSETLDIPANALVNITGYFDNMTLVGLSTFVIDGIDINIFTGRIKVNLTFTELELEGIYDLNGTALFNILPIFGRGNFVVALNNVTLDLDLTASDDTAEGLQVDIHDLHIHTETATVVMADLLGGGQMEFAFDVLLSKLTLFIINEAGDELLSNVTSLLTTVINADLRGTSQNEVADDGKVQLLPVIKNKIDLQKRDY